VFSLCRSAALLMKFIIHIEFLGTFAFLRSAYLNRFVHMYTCNNFRMTEWIFMTFGIGGGGLKNVEPFQFW
jgi:hypothetical protein